MITHIFLEFIVMWNTIILHIHSLCISTSIIQCENA